MGETKIGYKILTAFGNRYYSFLASHLFRVDDQVSYKQRMIGKKFFIKRYRLNKPTLMAANHFPLMAFDSEQSATRWISARRIKGERKALFKGEYVPYHGRYLFL